MCCWVSCRTWTRSLALLTRIDWLGVLWFGVTGYYQASFLDFAGLQYITPPLERLILYSPHTGVVIGFCLCGAAHCAAAGAGRLIEA